ARRTLPSSIRSLSLIKKCDNTVIITSFPLLTFHNVRQGTPPAVNGKLQSDPAASPAKISLFVFHKFILRQECPIPRKFLPEAALRRSPDPQNRSKPQTRSEPQRRPHPGNRPDP